MKVNGSLIEMDERDVLYLVKYFTSTGPDATDHRYRAWQSTICQECGQVPTPGGHPHIVDSDSFVLICCEGYHQVNPNVLGLKSEGWHDWHEEMGGLEPPTPPELEHLTIKCVKCGMTQAQCLAQGEAESTPCCDICIHAEGP